MDEIVEKLREVQCHVMSFSDENCPEPKDNTEEVLRDLIPATHFSIQKTPPTGDCFFYCIALIISRNLCHYPTEIDTPKAVVDVMLCLRKVCAAAVYNSEPDYTNTSLLTTRFCYLNDYEKNIMDWHDANVKPCRDLFFAYYLAVDPRPSYPFADHVDKAIIQRLPFFSRSVIVVFNTDKLRMSEINAFGGGKSDAARHWVCDFYFPGEDEDTGTMPPGLRIRAPLRPPQYDHLIVMRRSGAAGGGEHYEPVVFFVQGQWQHQLPIAEKDGPVYGRLFEAIATQCPADFRRQMERVGQFRTSAAAAEPMPVTPRKTDFY